jgi:hypothetical protein
MATTLPSLRLVQSLAVSPFDLCPSGRGALTHVLPSSRRFLKLISLTACSTRHIVRIFDFALLSIGKRNCYAGKKLLLIVRNPRRVEQVWIGVKVSKVEGVDPLSNTDSQRG